MNEIPTNALRGDPDNHLSLLPLIIGAIVSRFVRCEDDFDTILYPADFNLFMALFGCPFRECSVRREGSIKTFLVEKVPWTKQTARYRCDASPTSEYRHLNPKLEKDFQIPVVEL